MDNCGVYKITCSNGRFYYGRSVKIRERLVQHLYALKRGGHAIKDMQKDFNKFGERAFKFIIVKKTKTNAEAGILEKKLVNKYIKSENCYNKAYGSVANEPKITHKVYAYIDDDIYQWLKNLATTERSTICGIVRRTLAEHMIESLPF